MIDSVANNDRGGHGNEEYRASQGSQEHAKGIGRSAEAAAKWGKWRGGRKRTVEKSSPIKKYYFYQFFC